MDPALLELAGIQPSYTDIWDKEHQVPAASLAAILAALELKDPPQTPPAPLVLVVAADEAGTVPWLAEAPTLHREDGAIEALIPASGQLVLPALPAGYHRLDYSGGATTLLAAPSRCWMPREIAEGKRYWGLAAQLYGLASERNWGIGDFTDLIQLVQQAGAKGAGVVGLNPLHALFPGQPDSFSPYAPSNRLYLNYLYIDPDALPNDEGTPQPSLEWQRAAQLIDYPFIAKTKRKALEAGYERFAARGGNAVYDAFRHEQGEPLFRQAVFDALSEHFAEEASWWGDWPAEYHDPAGTGVKDFAAAHDARVGFFTWLQWVADVQLAQAQRAAKESGMLLGLYRDLAVGSGLSGAEVWQDPNAYVRGVSVGAPPDEYNRRGQNWGLPPFNPVTLRRSGYRALISLLRANMRHAGAIRIDHAFALSRLFWVPEGMGADAGAYVTYPFDEMLAVLKIESHRQQCLIIGEDLGTFPPGYKEKAAEAGVFSYRVLFFERDAETFNPPSRYPGLALATVATHDLPTLAGWSAAGDIDVKSKLGLYPDAKMEQAERAGRKKDMPRLLAAFRAEGLDDEPAVAAPLYLAKSPAALVMLQLEDLIGVKEQANLPATTTEHPNWRRRLPVSLGEIFADNALLARLVSRLKAARTLPAPARPRATYRLQFHKGFTFDDAAKIMPYLASLGISHVYASPYTMARPGSTHGYDVFDPTRFNPELGGEKGYRRYFKALKENGLQQILDFVPNHMGVGEGNAWWHDVLRLGRDSAYARFFDIDWERGSKLRLPVLGKTLAEAIEAGEITLSKEKTGWVAQYFDKPFPLRPDVTPPSAAPMKEQLTALLAEQHWELIHWQRAAEDINYRRFFEINDLAGLRIEDPQVFAAAHRLAFSLLAKGELAGLRIDHVDGLADPKAYLEALQRHAGPNLYVVIEKILEPGEKLRADWPVAGTSGYEVLNEINNLFVDPRAEDVFDRFYSEFSGQIQKLPDMLKAAKRQMLEKSFDSEWSRLARLASAALKADEPELKAAIGELLVAFPVYRSYVDRHSVEDDLALFDAAAEGATSSGEIALLRGLFANPSGAPEFVSRFQQLSGPLMAKGLEDTSFYRYQRFLSLNEVGGEPSHFGSDTATFHAQNRERLKTWPGNLVATTTHDTKRGEDARARLNILSQLGAEWGARVAEWSRLLRTKDSALSCNDEYMLYQALLASWPLELLEKPGKKELAAYHERMKAYLEKALREAKQITTWTAPDEAYEKAAQDFLSLAVTSSEFQTAFLPFVRKIAKAGAVNSYAQTLLKYTIPGVPDLYQGCEFFDFSLVDPDNRRPVDYAARERALTMIDEPETLLATWADGRLKQRLIHALLQHRGSHHALYDEGEYLPLPIKGAKEDRAVAFLRRTARESLVVVVPRFVADAEHWALDHYWADTRIVLPDGAAPHTNLLTGRTHSGNEMQLSEMMDVLPFAVLGS